MITSLELESTSSVLRPYFFGTPSFESEYVLFEETEGVLTDTLMMLQDWHLTWLSHLKPYVKVGQSL